MRATADTDEVRRKRGRMRRLWPLPYAVLAVGIVVLAAALYLIIQELDRDTRRIRAEFRENAAWYAGQFESELSALIAALDAYRLEEAGASHDELVRRFDVYWSRIHGAGSGVVGKTFMEFEGLPALIAEAKRVLRDIEPTVLSLAPGDAVGHRKIKSRLRSLLTGFRNIGLAGVHRQNAETAALYRRIADGHSKLLIIFAGVMAGSVILIGLILLEMRQVKALRDSLEQRVAERTRDLLQEIEQREHAQEEVRNLNAELEARVEARTAELHAAQDALVRKERLAALGQLTGTVAHEVRNPLGAVAASIGVIRQRASATGLDIDRALSRAERGIKRCDAIITELLDFTRAKGHRPRAMSLDDWLAGVIYENGLPEGIATAFDLGTNGAKISFDPEELRRAVINVVDNACQAMTNGARDAAPAPMPVPGATMTVTTRATNERVEIEIADNGPGIPADVLPRVVEPLFSTKPFGTGLGLPTVQRIMDDHGGGLEITSTAAEGTRVVLWLPRDAGGGVEAGS